MSVAVLQALALAKAFLLAWLLQFSFFLASAVEGGGAICAAAAVDVDDRERQQQPDCREAAIGAGDHKHETIGTSSTTHTQVERRYGQIWRRRGGSASPAPSPTCFGQRSGPSTAPAPAIAGPLPAPPPLTDALQ
uniref:Secreted protein n=1 Tax=Leersia perrieri TaxID=77586 RepID=A0A0D9WNZ3_9ORYZ